MTNVLDWILDLFRDPVQAQAFINDPDKTMQNAGVQNVSAAQVNAVAASVAPAAIIQGGGNPVHGLQQAVAQTHGIAFAPQHVFAPETQAFSNNDTLSHNDVLSNNDPHILSPEAGHDVQQGGVNLDFGDITFGDKNTASDGSVINTGNAGDIDNTNVHGDGNVVGDGNVGANTGDILAGEGSTVQAGGVGNTSDSHGSVTNTGGGDVISGNEGPVVKTLLDEVATAGVPSLGPPVGQQSATVRITDHHERPRLGILGARCMYRALQHLLDVGVEHLAVRVEPPAGALRPHHLAKFGHLNRPTGVPRGASSPSSRWWTGRASRPVTACRTSRA